MTWAMVAALGGMVGLPLTVMVMYLRAIREDQKQLRTDHSALERRVGYVERDATTKEEFVRETAVFRQQQQKQTELLVSLTERTDVMTGLVTQFSKLTEALVEAVRR